MPTYSVSIPGRGTFDVESPTPLTDYQAYLAVQQQLGAEPPPPPAPVVAPPPEGGFFPSVKRGFLQAGMLAGDILPAMAARAVGADEYAERQLKEAAETQARIQREVPAAVPSFTDISSLGDAWTYAKEAVGESLASIIPTLLTGGIAGFAARPAIAAANNAAREAAEATLLATAMRAGPPTQAAIEAAKKEAIDAGIKAAQRTAFKYEFAGGFAGSAVQNVPEVYQNILEETGKESIPAALAFGGFNAALDTVLPAKLLAKMRGQGLSPTETMAAWYARGAKGLGKGFLIEGATEAAQESSSIAAENFIAENSDFFNQKNLERVINAGLKGGLGGGVITGAADIALGQAPLPEVTDRQRAEQLQREILGEIDVARAQQLKEEEEAAALAKAEAERPPTVNEIISMASSPTGYEDLESEKQRLLKQPRTEETREAIKTINEIQQRIIVEEQQRRAPSVRVPSIDDLVSLAQMPDGYAQLEVEKQNLLKQRKTPEIKEALDAIKDFQTRMVTEQAERQRPPLEPVFDDKTIRSLGFVKSENPNSVYQQLIGKSVADPDAVNFLERYATTAREQTKDRIDRFLKQVERYQIPLTAEEAAQGATDVREAVTAPSGAGIPVVGEPPTIPAARGPGAVEPTGMVPVETDVGQPPRREAAAPAPVAPPALLPPPPITAPAPIQAAPVAPPVTPIPAPVAAPVAAPEVPSAPPVATPDIDAQIASLKEDQNKLLTSTNKVPAPRSKARKQFDALQQQIDTLEAQKTAAPETITEKTVAATKPRKVPTTVMGSSLLALVNTRLRGLSPSLLSEFSHRVPTNRIGKDGKQIQQWRNPLIPGFGTLFRSGGTSDYVEIAQMLEEAGYLEPGSVEADYKGAGERAKDLIKEALYKGEVLTLDEQIEQQRKRQEEMDQEEQRLMDEAKAAQAQGQYPQVDTESAAQAEADKQPLLAEAKVDQPSIDTLTDDEMPFDVDVMEDVDIDTWMREQGFADADIQEVINGRREAAVAETTTEVEPEEVEAAAPVREAAPGPVDLDAAVDAEPSETKADQVDIAVVGDALYNSDLTEEETTSLETAYKSQVGSAEFIRRLTQDVQKYITDGAKAVAAGIRSAVKKIAQAVLSIAVVFNANVAFPDAQLYAKAQPSALEVPDPGYKKQDLFNANGRTLSPNAARVANWIASQNKQDVSLILDPFDGKMYVMKGREIVADAPALYGKAGVGEINDTILTTTMDKMIPDQKITPAGVFRARLEKDAQYGTAITFMDAYTGSYAIHRAYLGNPSERRADRLKNSDPADNNISYGCVNVSNDFYDNVLAKLDFSGEAYAYMLPSNIAQLKKFFPKASLAQAPKAPKPLKLSKETEAKIEELGKIMQRIMGKFGLKDVALNIERDLKNNGEYANRLIKLALDADSPVRDLRHESLHAMKELGFFSDAQWKTLEKMARDKWVDKYLKNAPSTYNGETMSRYDAYMRLYNGNEETILEEAIADAFSDFDITKPPPGLMQALLRRMRDLFRGIKEAMGIANIDSAEDIFRRVEKGELKETAAAPAPAEAPKPSLRAPETEAFKNWFGNSKVVDNNGDPLVVYHGTSYDITEFDTRADMRRGVFRSNELGSWFSENPTVANAFATGIRFPRKDGNVMPVYLSIKNPLTVYTYRDLERMAKGRRSAAAMRRDLEKEGYDGILIVNSTTDTGTVRQDWVAFRPEQIKSAIGNIGTYSPTTADIRYSLRAPTTPAFKKWFGDSKIVNPDGTPKVMYHGTARDITEFRPKQAGAIFVAPEPRFAEGFAYSSEEWMQRNYRDVLTEKQIADAQQKAIRAVRETYGDGRINRSAVQKLIADIEGGNPKGEARDYFMTAVAESIESGPNIVPVYVRAENPFDYENPKHVADAINVSIERGDVEKGDRESLVEDIASGSWDFIEEGYFQRAIRALGHDGFYIKEGGVKNLAVYKPEQLKSATGNIGTFDITKPDIRASLRVIDMTELRARQLLAEEEAETKAIRDELQNRQRREDLATLKDKIYPWLKENMYAAERARRVYNEAFPLVDNLGDITWALSRYEEIAKEAHTGVYGEENFYGGPSEGNAFTATRNAEYLLDNNGKEVSDTISDYLRAVNDYRGTLNRRSPRQKKMADTLSKIMDNVVVADFGKDAKASLRDASWDKQRIDSLINQFGYTDGRTYGMAAYVNPNDFVIATTSSPENAQLIRDEAGKLDQKKLAKETQTPFLEWDIEKNIIIGHEGRHRMAALADAGVKEAPVVLWVKDRYGSKKPDQYTPRSSANIAGQRFESGRGGSLPAKNLVPLSYKYAAQLRDEFGGEAKVRYSLRSGIPLATRQRIDQTTTSRKEDGFVERILDAISPQSFSTFRTQFINRYNQLSVYDKKLAQQMGGVKLLADTSAEAAALFSDLGAGLTASALGVHDRAGGIPVYRNGITIISNQNGTVKGPVAIFAPLAKYGDPFAYQSYQFWSGVKRGSRFMADGREQLFEPADVQKAEALRKQFLQDGVDFEAIQKEWIKFNDGLVDYMVATGVLSSERAAIYKQHSDYLPFYRQMNGEDTVGPKVFQAISGVKPPKKLKGGEAPLDDFLENIVRNVQSGIQAGVKNVAAQRAADVAVKINMANKLNYQSSGPNIFHVYENGRQVSYASQDMLFINAVKSLGLPDIPFIGMLSGPSNLLRNLVTKDPAFMLANLMRDSMAAWVTSGAKMTPLVDTMRNFGAALSGKSPEFQDLLNAGIIGGYEFSQNVEQSGRELDKALRKQAGTKAPGMKGVLEMGAKPVTSLWEALEKGTTASDAATRIEIYKRTLAETGNEAEALYRSLEVMNFNRKGSSAIIRILTAAVPFLNARIQGLDVLYRAASGQMNRADAKEVQRQFFVRGATIAAISAAYWALTHDDEEYKKQEQETRDNYWLLPSLGIKIPIPFEIGVLFKVIPERILAYTMGSDTGEDFLKSMARQLTSTLAFNPIPQAVLPVVESMTNFSFFTMRPIVGQGLDGVQAAYQVGPGTSRLAEFLGDATKGLAKELQISPMKLDQLISGYTGTMGMYLVNLMDAIYDMNTDSPKPSRRFEQMPFIRRFAVDPEARGSVTAYYDLKNSVDAIVRTSNMLERTMNYEELPGYLQDNAMMLASKDYILDLEKTMKEFREMKIMIRSATMAADAKRDAVSSIEKMENQLTANIQYLKSLAKSGS